MQCAECGTTEGRIINSAKYGTHLCGKCYQRQDLGGKIHPIPPFATVTYDENGYPICHECGRAYKKVLTHVWQIHGLSEKEYKEKHGLFTSKGICCEETREKLRVSVSNNYDLVVAKNLHANGNGTRYKKGDPGRVLMSPQLLIQLKSRGGAAKC